MYLPPPWGPLLEKTLTGERVTMVDVLLLVFFFQHIHIYRRGGWRQGFTLKIFFLALWVVVVDILSSLNRIGERQYSARWACVTWHVRHLLWSSCSPEGVWRGVGTFSNAEDSGEGWRAGKRAGGDNLTNLRAGLWQNHFSQTFFICRRLFLWILPPDLFYFYVRNGPEKSCSWKICGKILSNKNPRHISAEGPG